MNVLWLAAIPVLLPAIALPQQQNEPTFQVDVKLVRVIATVKDTYGRPVAGLNKEDLIVLDNGALQQIAVFERHTSQPLSIAILLDISGSTAKEMKYQTDGVSRFIRALFGEGNSDDRASLYTFNWQIVQDVPWARSPGRFAGKMRQLKAEGGTALYDAVLLASEGLGEREGRHVIIVVTDGGDTVSSTDFHKALEAIHQSDAVLYSILTVPVTADAGRNVGGENALTTFARTTGGKVFAPGIEGLDQAFSDILRDLRTQYLIGFYPRNVPLTKDRFHRLEIKTQNPELRVVSRTGYYGDAESSTDSPRR